MDWRLILSTFGLLFLAELGDKTQLAVIVLTAQHKNPWPILIGAIGGLAAVTVLGVVFGMGLAQLIPEVMLKKGAASSLS
ncbi:MAG: hypothetical protein HW403_1504 [Dehalococcoidia bacterium]|nr:hypothetical protein [Dehalococcoidia bacterium]